MTSMPPSGHEDLDNYSLLHVIGYEEGWGYWLNQLGYHSIDASQGIHFDSLMTAMEMAAQGHGVALEPDIPDWSHAGNGRLITPFLTDYRDV